jgi:hypothetical protein
MGNNSKQLSPFIVLPNDDNKSDSDIFMMDGSIVSVSEFMRQHSQLKFFLKDGLKLMCDGDQHEDYVPLKTVSTYEGVKYISISFFCSKDNFGRKTSMAIVFNFDKKNEAIELLNIFKNTNIKLFDVGKIEELVASSSFYTAKALSIKKKILIISTSLLLIGILIVFLSRSSRKKQPVQSSESTHIMVV